MARQLTFEQALHCAKCGTQATFVEECTDTAFSPGEITLIECSSCREKPWIYCRSCKTKCYRNGLLLHATRKKHIEQHEKVYPTAVPAPDPPAGDDTVIPDFPEAIDSIQLFDEIEETLMNAPESFHEQMDIDLAATHSENATTPMEISGKKRESPTSCNFNRNDFPGINMAGNEWLARAMEAVPIATIQDMFGAFSGTGMHRMKNFWVAELGSGLGRCGGGAKYLSAICFQQCKDSQLDKERFPDLDEALWHLLKLMQYDSMNREQRRRQSRVDKTLLENFQAGIFFRETFIPTHQQLGRYYGTTGKYSMKNNLPYPQSRDIGGVAYVSPKAAIAYLMANGIPIDEVQVTSNDKENLPYKKVVHSASESKKAVDWINSIRCGYYGSDRSVGAPNSKNGAPTSPTAMTCPAVICLLVSDWADGFGPGKVKNNRNAVDCKTITISPPRTRLSTSSNTLPIALGLKKAKGWKQVEWLFREELEELTNSCTPVFFYNGAIQKVIPCFVRRFAVLSDKIERNGLTSTLGCGSDIHRRFAVSGRIQTPSCNVQAIDRYLKKEVEGKVTPKFGWSDKFVNRSVDTNGSIFPACPNCRKFGLQQIGVVFLDANIGNTGDRCTQCTYWELLPHDQSSIRLDFPVHKQYPTSATDGCPVHAPAGRNVFAEEIKLPFVKIEFSLMKQACRYTFYQVSRPKHAWTKANALCYLKHCGVSTEVAECVFKAGKDALKSKEQDNVDYSHTQGIGTFQFPAAWLSTQLKLEDYIEAPMHLLFLGLTESNYDLITKWLSSTPAAAKLGISPFKSALQHLIKDLRGFSLSWLAAYPLTGKKGSLGTGSWVAENWSFLVRISQFIYGWCARDHNCSKHYGVDDMSRMVISFHALVARLLTHSGVTKRHIKETELYLKEFLSAVRELDIRVRHQILNASVARATDTKKTEAWWLKPNYMSLINLLYMLASIGPIVEWWDGGFRGERFIQLVKPLIKNGVREDILSFFQNIMDKFYQSNQLDLLAKLYGLCEAIANDDSHAAFVTLQDVLEELTGLLAPDDNEDDITLVDETENGDDEGEFEHPDAYFSNNEVLGMTKKRTIYIYRNERQMNEAITAKKPLAGIVEVTKDTNTGKTAFKFKLVFRKPVKQFACREVDFDDCNGIHFHGLWCAVPTVKNDIVYSTSSFGDIQAMSKLAAVAIPLRYVLGNDHPDSNKYCVITNWWKYRMSDGWYRLPTLDATLYGAQFAPAENSLDPLDLEDEEPMVETTIQEGMEFGRI